LNISVDVDVLDFYVSVFRYSQRRSKSFLFYSRKRTRPLSNNACTDYPAPKNSSALTQFLSTRATRFTCPSRWSSLALSPMAPTRQRRVRRGRRILRHLRFSHHRTFIQRACCHRYYKGHQVLGSQGDATIAPGLHCPSVQFPKSTVRPTGNYLGHEHTTDLSVTILCGKLGASSRFS